MYAGCSDLKETSQQKVEALETASKAIYLVMGACGSCTRSEVEKEEGKGEKERRSMKDAQSIEEEKVSGQIQEGREDRELSFLALI